MYLKNTQRYNNLLLWTLVTQFFKTVENLNSTVKLTPYINPFPPPPDNTLPIIATIRITIVTICTTTDHSTNVIACFLTQVLFLKTVGISTLWRHQVEIDNALVTVRINNIGRQRRRKKMVSYCLYIKRSFLLNL